MPKKNPGNNTSNKEIQVDCNFGLHAVFAVTKICRQTADGWWNHLLPQFCFQVISPQQNIGLLVVEDGGRVHPQVGHEVNQGLKRKKLLLSFECTSNK